MSIFIHTNSPISDLLVDPIDYEITWISYCFAEPHHSWLAQHQQAEWAHTSAVVNLLLRYFILVCLFNLQYVKFSHRQYLSKTIHE